MESEFQDLAGLRSDADPIVSLYLDTDGSDQVQRERVRLFVQDRLQWARLRSPPDHLATFQKTLARIEEYAEGLFRQAFDESARGIAVFACEGIGLWRVFPFNQKLRNSLTLGPTPHLLQLARLAYDFQPAVVTIVDTRGAWVLETALGKGVAESRISHETHRRHSMGGWSQIHYQRHVEQQIERNHQEAAKHVAFLLDRDPKSQLILAGTDRAVGAFEKVLPERARARILTRLPAPGERGYRTGEIRDQVLRGAIEEAFAHERSLEQSDVHNVVGEALAGGLAVLGPEDVALAATEARIHRLLIEDGFEQTGWRCTNCNAVGIKTVNECSYCGQEVEGVSLGEELARRVIAEGGDVDVMEPQALLHHYFGLAAVLRNRGSVAAIGAAPEPLAYGEPAAY
ncbi:Vms1/Ankzf1 family peptidyl-tRNA hydrolase [Vulgatibacter incomptus]|nr:Vms1/Ankzf1 family peptidyl-tRNA hydrolase [Vulgatibacter incomptus]